MLEGDLEADVIRVKFSEAHRNNEGNELAEVHAVSIPRTSVFDDSGMEVVEIDGNFLSLF